MLVRGHDAYGHFDAEAVAARPTWIPTRWPRHADDHRSPAAHPLRRRAKPAAGSTRARRGAAPPRASPSRPSPHPPGDDMRHLHSTRCGRPGQPGRGHGRRGTGRSSIRFAHSLSTTEPAHLAAEFFAKNVAARTNGKVQIQVFPGEQLGLGQGRQRDDPPGRQRDEHHRPRLPVGLRARHRRAERPLPDQDAAGIRQAAGLRLVQGHREEARSRRLQADHGQRLLRPAPPDRRQAGAQARRHGRHDGARAAQHDVDRDLQGDGCAADDGAVVRGLQRAVSRTSSQPPRRRSARCGARSCTRRARSSRLTGHFTAFVMWPINASYFNKLPRPTCRRCCSKKARRPATR